HGAAYLADNRLGVWVPLAQLGAGVDLLALFHQQRGTVWDDVGVEDAVAGAQQLDLAVAGQDHRLAGVVLDQQRNGPGLVAADETLQGAVPGPLGLDLARDGTALGGDAADVERPHRQLRARLADRLGGDDPHRHAFLNQRPGGQVHAVAQPAHAQWGGASHGAADDHLVDAQPLDLVGLLTGDH